MRGCQSWNNTSAAQDVIFYDSITGTTSPVTCDFRNRLRISRRGISGLGEVLVEGSVTNSSQAYQRNLGIPKVVRVECDLQLTKKLFFNAKSCPACSPPDRVEERYSILEAQYINSLGGDNFLSRMVARYERCLRLGTLTI